jgi:hypothetical protein
MFSAMAGDIQMLKTKRPIPVAKPRKEVEDIHSIYRDTMKRFPKTMALLAE